MPSAVQGEIFYNRERYADATAATANMRSAITRYHEAIAALGHISTIRPVPSLADTLAALTQALTPALDPSLTRARDDLLRGGSDPIALHNYVRAAEVVGIASAVATCFENTPHHACAINAFLRAWLSVFGDAQGWYIARSQFPSNRDSDDSYRASLLQDLDWLHQFGTLSGDTGDDPSYTPQTILCPLTTYLQLIIRSTPIEDWAAATAADPAHLSPLRLAWDLARASPAISPHTVDVVVLVTMGRHMQRFVARSAAKAAPLSRYEGLWASLGILWGRQQQKRSESRRAHRGEEYTPINEPDTAEALQLIAEKLREVGEEYAQLLSKQRSDITSSDVQSILVRLRTYTTAIASKAQPLVPSSVFVAISCSSGKQE